METKYQVIIIPFGVTKTSEIVKPISPTLLKISHANSKWHSIIFPPSQDGFDDEVSELFWEGVEVCSHCGKGYSQQLHFDELQSKLYKEKNANGGWGRIVPFCLYSHHKTLIVHSDEISKNEQILISRFQELIDETILIRTSDFIKLI